MIVVDSSVWIAFLRRRDTATVRRLVAYIEDDSVELAITDVILAELLSGAKDEHARDDLRERLLAFPVLSVIGLDDFETAADIMRLTRTQPRPARRLMDCLIAAVAIRHDASVLHDDQDFATIAAVTTLRIE